MDYVAADGSRCHSSVNQVSASYVVLDTWSVLPIRIFFYGVLVCSHNMCINGKNLNDGFFGNM